MKVQTCLLGGSGLETLLCIEAGGDVNVSDDYCRGSERQI